MKYPIVLQHSEEDCGAACLATIVKYYGHTFSLSRVREAVGTGSQGTTLVGLRRGAEELGFIAKQVQATPEIIDHLGQVPLPVIIHWKGNHWVVLYGQQGKHYVIADPGIGIRRLTYEELKMGWANGVMLILEPDRDRFDDQPNDKLGGFGRFLRRVWLYRWILAEAIARALVSHPPIPS